MNTEEVWNAVKTEMREISLLYGASASLVWDQQTYMPPGSARQRGEQMALLSRLVHERATSAKLGAWLEELVATDLPETQAVGVSRLKTDYDRSTRVPASLVERSARASASGFEAWMRAKEASDFSLFLAVIWATCE